MTVVLPISHVDAELAKKLCGWLEEIDSGSYPHNTVVVFVTKLAEPVFADVESALRKVFGKVEKVLQQTEDERGWPFSSNTIFREIAYYIGQHPEFSKNPWYFFEADNTPVRKGWLREFEQEYKQSGKAFMGYLQPTLYEDKNTGEFVETWPHMVGTGVYPGDFCHRSHLIKFPYSTAFDIHHMGEVVSDLHTVNEMIQHNWGTSNYRDSKGRIVCKAKKAPQYFAKYVKPKSLVVHGCKDGTLIDALRERSQKQKKRQEMETTK